MKPSETEKKIIDYQILKRLFEFILPYKRQFYILVFLIILSAILAPALPLLIQSTIDGPIAERDYNKLAVFLGIMIGVLILNSIISYFNTYQAGWLSQQIIHDISLKVFKKIIALKLKYYDQTPIGRLVTRTISDVESLSEVFKAILSLT